MSATFFIDRNLGKRFGYTLRAAGLSVELHDDHFSEMTPDIEWIPGVAERGWVAITKDDRIRYRPLERTIVMSSGARVMLLTGKADLRLHAENVVRTHAAIERFIAKNAAPWFAKLHRPSPGDLLRRPEAPGSVERWGR